MIEYFLRVFIKDTYIDYDMRIQNIVTFGTGCDINIKSDVVNYVRLSNNKIETNLINIDVIEVNKMYYVSKFNIIFKVGIYCQKKQYLIQTVHLNKMFNTAIDVKLKGDILQFNNHLYVTKKLYYNRDFKLGFSTTICMSGIEFTIENGTIFIHEECNVCHEYCTEYSEKSIEKLGRYEIVLKDNVFEYEYDYKEFNESALKYVLSPLLIMVTMGVVSFITKRQSLIIFMFASSLSSIIASLTTYLLRKRTINVHNVFVKNQFEYKASLFIKELKQSIKQQYMKMDFHILRQKEIILGYIHEDDFVDIKINNKELGEKFKALLSAINGFLIPLDFKQYNSLRVDGKYANLYILNILIQMEKVSKYSVVVVGDTKIISSVTLISNVNDLKKINANQEYICIVYDIQLFTKCYNLKHKNIIYVNCGENYKTCIVINELFKNKVVKLNDVVCTKELYIQIESNKKLLYILYQRNIFESNNRRQLKDGIMLSEDMFLDFDKDGPHGLIVGMTGSGKSILLQTIILGISNYYTTKEAVIGIIDFKGESLVSKVGSLPHICATYSNLTNNYMHILKSIEAELTYRQKLFKKHGISEYAEINGKFSLPRLFLIIDEFAEVKNKAQDLMIKIDSIARIGRSLGIFLVLALQKSSGIINDQLKSNLNYKICLRVNSIQDSKDVINVDSAFHFDKPGQAAIDINNKLSYFKVFNFQDTMKDNVIVNKINYNQNSYIEENTYQLCESYNKSSYVVWKSFPKNGTDIYIDNVDYKKHLKYKITYDNYIIVGKKQSGKSELVKTIMSNIACVTFYIGNNKSFSNLVDNYVENVNQVEILANFCINLRLKSVFIIDGYDTHTSEFLTRFISDVINYKYINIRVIITSFTVNSTLSRLVKLVENRFLLSYNDPSELYNMFFCKLDFVKYEVGEGVCNVKGDVLNFKNYLKVLPNSKKSFCIKNLSGYYYLDSFKEVDLSEAIIIFDYLDLSNKNYYSKDWNGEYPLYIHYKDVNNDEVRKLIDNAKQLFTITEKFEYKYKRIKVFDKMLYDCINEETVINIDNLNIL